MWTNHFDYELVNSIKIELTMSMNFRTSHAMCVFWGSLWDEGGATNPTYLTPRVVTSAPDNGPEMAPPNMFARALRVHARTQATARATTTTKTRTKTLTWNTTILRLHSLSRQKGVLRTYPRMRMPAPSSTYHGRVRTLHAFPHTCMHARTCCARACVF